MQTDWDNDERLIAELGAAVRAERDVPTRFVEAGKAAFAWRNVDDELAALTYDSAAGGAELAGTRAEPAGLRTLTFTARALTIELEVTPDSLVGQLVPAQAGEIETMSRGGRANTVPVDDVGWFVISPRPDGPFRLRVRAADGAEVVTQWTTL